MLVSKIIESHTRQVPVVLLSDGFHDNDSNPNQRPSLIGLRVSVIRRDEQVTCSGTFPIEIYAFLGVPFADKPDRFAPPLTQRRLWSGQRQATSFGPICPQPVTTMRQSYHPRRISEVMSEDCLYLNIWTPSIDRASKLPVLVWIVGGLYVNAGSNYFDGTAYASTKNVVFVSFNYRVGLLGFLSTGDGIVPGNMGLLDQVEALRWIHRHIDVFGGDPDNVTLIGDSCGAMCISWHMLSPRSQGLFRRGIFQGGTICYYSSVMSRLQARIAFKQVVKSLGLDHCNGVQDAIAFLRAMPVTDIVDRGPHLLYYPIVDGDVILEHPMTSLYERRFSGQQFDALFIVTTDEAYYFTINTLRKMSGTPTTSVPRVDVSLAKKMVHSLVFERYFVGHPAGDQIYEALCDEYIKDVDDSELLLKRLVEMWGDLLFISPSAQLAKLLSDSSSISGSGTRTYFCQFDHRPSYSRHSGWASATHGHQVPFVLGLPFIVAPSNKPSDEDLVTTELVLTACSNFARNGNPNIVCQELTCWQEYDVMNRSYLNLCSHPSVRRDFRRQRMDFWQSIVDRFILNNLHSIGVCKL